MLQIVRHLFFNSGDILTSMVSSNEPSMMNASKMTNITKKVVSKKESLAERLMTLWA
jgi:hypothetical protein